MGSDIVGMGTGWGRGWSRRWPTLGGGEVVVRMRWKRGWSKGWRSSGGGAEIGERLGVEDEGKGGGKGLE